MLKKNVPVVDVTIRKMKKEDREDIAEIYEAITQGRDQVDIKRVVEEQVAKEFDASFVAEFSGRVVGYMFSYITVGNFGVSRCAWISMFGVDPKFMGQGIGLRLAEEIFDYHKKKGIQDVFTSVRWDYTDILSFFKTIGFERSQLLQLRKTLE